jgi:hypothetical protein
MRSSSLLVATASFFAALVSDVSASAKVTVDSPYTRAQTFNGALRYIRVDQQYEVIEKDLETGYFLFKYKADSGPATGSVQVLEAGDRVRLVVQIPQYPEYHEHVVSKGISEKLHEEYGDPPEREPAKPKEPERTEPQKPSQAPRTGAKKPEAAK